MTPPVDSRGAEKAFSTPKFNGLHLRFPNGNMISTIWGVGSYSENYDIDGFKDFTKLYESNTPSNTVEVMVDCSDELFKKLQRRYKTSNTVFGHLNMKQWIKLVNDVSSEPAPRKANK